MHTYVALLRGINVGGHRKIKMEALREMFTKLGCQEVKSYIQSGNIIFRADETNIAFLEDKIKTGIYETFGFDVPTLVRTGAYFQKVLANNKFTEVEEKDFKYLHVSLFSSVPDQALINTLNPEDYLPEVFSFGEQEVYLYCPKGYHKSKLSNNFFEKKWKVQATTRNWKTMRKLNEMIINYER